MIVPEFYLHYAAEPWCNMAFDEWLLARAERETGFAAVRLYTWAPGGITFGVNQRLEKAFDRSKLGETAAIRRVTGGRAIYHDPSELTYSIAVHSNDCVVPAWRGGRSETATNIAHLLRAFLRAVGLAADYARQSARENARPDFFHAAPCFESHARYELLTDEGKVVASAQRRLEHSFLQHGSIKLAGVADHPALRTNRPAKELPALDRTRFDFLAGRFREVFRHEHGADLAPTPITAEGRDVVAMRCREVRKNSLARRDVIKQNDAGVSL